MGNGGIYKMVSLNINEEFLLSDTHIGIWDYLTYEELQKIEGVAKSAIERVKIARERLGIRPLPPKEENVE